MSSSSGWSGGITSSVIRELTDQMTVRLVFESFGVNLDQLDSAAKGWIRARL